ncbi:hypothetical protein JZ751_003799 [Albula glossodonta]|uniref:Uncharacterized protein n=1 Tax=Albula glossodonta TaxID=121402 RepID=A0A8T2P5H9_9TELE|nr:hypothetical protein JZ751_003799 [Albula glossodonta]
MLFSVKQAGTSRTVLDNYDTLHGAVAHRPGQMTTVSGGTAVEYTAKENTSIPENHLASPSLEALLLSDSLVAESVARLCQDSAGRAHRGLSKTNHPPKGTVFGMPFCKALSCKSRGRAQDTATHPDYQALYLVTQYSQQVTPTGSCPCQSSTSGILKCSLRNHRLETFPLQDMYGSALSRSRQSMMGYLRKLVVSCRRHVASGPATAEVILIVCGEEHWDIGIWPKFAMLPLRVP